MAKLDSQSLSKRVTDILGQEIVNGTYSTETEFPTEAALCERYGISRTAVREAVKMLSAKGLISSKARQGIRVMPTINWNLYDSQILGWLLESAPSLEKLREFLQVRIAIEPQAAYLAAQSQDNEAIEKIADAMAKMDAAVLSPTGSIHEGDLEFHVAILLASGNQFIAQLKEFIETALNVSIRHTTPAKENLAVIADEHRQIYLAIKAGDAELAKSLMFKVNAEALAFIEKKISG